MTKPEYSVALITTLDLSKVDDIVNVEFCRHSVDKSPTAVITLKNGWKLSILSGSMFYASGNGETFEVGLINHSGKLDYTLYYDVWAYQTPSEIVEIIKQAAGLPKPVTAHSQGGNI